MATTASFDAKQFLVDGTAAGYPLLDQRAKAGLDRILEDAAVRLAVEPHRASEATQSMDRLVELLEQERSRSLVATINETQLSAVFAKGGFCPAFPFC